MGPASALSSGRDQCGEKVAELLKGERMKTKTELMARDFKNWGHERVKRVLRFTKKYGVIMSKELFSNKKKG